MLLSCGENRFPGGVLKSTAPFPACDSKCHQLHSDRCVLLGSPRIAGGLSSLIRHYLHNPCHQSVLSLISIWSQPLHRQHQHHKEGCSFGVLKNNPAIWSILLLVGDGSCLRLPRAASNHRDWSNHSAIWGPSSLVDRGDGSYEVILCPMNFEMHPLAVNILLRPIRRHLFSVRVSDERFFSHTSSVSTPYR